MRIHRNGYRTGISRNTGSFFRIDHCGILSAAMGTLLNIYIFLRMLLFFFETSSSRRKIYIYFFKFFSAVLKMLVWDDEEKSAGGFSKRLDEKEENHNWFEFGIMMSSECLLALWMLSWGGKKQWAVILYSMQPDYFWAFCAWMHCVYNNHNH